MARSKHITGLPSVVRAGKRLAVVCDENRAPRAADLELINTSWFQEAMGIIMFDADLHDFDENARLTKEYVLSAGGRLSWKPARTRCSSGPKSNEKIWVKRICSRTPGGSVSSSNGQALISSSLTSGPNTGRHQMSVGE
jgi:hypothetical protein